MRDRAREQLPLQERKNSQIAVPWCTYFRKVILTEARPCSGTEAGIHQ